MKITIAYIAVTSGPITQDYCSRFVASYKAFPPMIEHETVVVCNGGPLPHETALIFSGLGSKFYPRKNDGGYDISAYIELANGICKDSDMLVCLGESNYFHRSGWLKRIVEAWERHGQGMYGPYASNVLRAHLQTTAFICEPQLLAGYPIKVNSRKDRYEFEHGRASLWRRTERQGKPVKLVTWDGEWNPRQFRTPKNVMWRGNQSNLLMFCNHSDRWKELPIDRKAKWSKSADRPFA